VPEIWYGASGARDALRRAEEALQAYLQSADVDLYRLRNLQTARDLAAAASKWSATMLKTPRPAPLTANNATRNPRSATDAPVRPNPTPSRVAATGRFTTALTRGSRRRVRLFGEENASALSAASESRPGVGSVYNAIAAERLAATARAVGEALQAVSAASESDYRAANEL
jgi:hypothetical protein